MPGTGHNTGVYHEEGFCYATRTYHSFHRSVIGVYASVRVRRLRAEPASQQRNERMHLGWPKSGLVRETHGPPGRSCAEWQLGLRQVRCLRSAKGPQAHALWPQPDEVGKILRAHTMIV
jgi:hypothetical protein